MRPTWTTSAARSADGAVLPLWCDAAATQPNLAPGLFSCLAKVPYGIQVAPRDFSGLLLRAAQHAGLSGAVRGRAAPSRGRAVAVTADRALFFRAAALGHEFLRIHTCTTTCRPAALESACRLSTNDVASYSVSGLRVVASWLRQRADEPWTATLDREFLELQWLIEASLARQPALDALLD